MRPAARLRKSGLSSAARAPLERRSQAARPPPFWRQHTLWRRSVVRRSMRRNAQGRNIRAVRFKSYAQSGSRKSHVCRAPQAPSGRMDKAAGLPANLFGRSVRVVHWLGMGTPPGVPRRPWLCLGVAGSVMGVFGLGA